MSTTTPTRPPDADERQVVPEALIEEARRRTRRRRLRNAAGAVAVALGALSLYAALAGGSGGAPVSAVGHSRLTGGNDPLPEELSYSYNGVWIVHRGGTRHLLAPDLFGSDWSRDGTTLAALRGEQVVLWEKGRITTTPLDHVADGPLWSPDGRRLAYQRGGRIHQEHGPNRTGIYVADRTGRHERLVASNAARDLNTFDWSPDGRRIAYVGKRKGGTALFVARVDDRTSAPIEIAAKNTSLPSWSPDGSWIAFNSGGSVELVRPDGSDLHKLIDGWGPVWSPDAGHLAFLGTDIAPSGVIASDGSGFQALPTCSCSLRGPGFWPTLSWSSDGTRIAFVGGRGNVVTTVRPDGTDAKRVAIHSARQWEGPWRPLWRPRP